MASKTKSLPNRVYEDALNQVIREKLNRSPDEFDITYSSGSAKGDNFIGVIQRVQVKEKGTENVKLSLIIKLAPANETTQTEMNTKLLFQRETDFYQKVYPMFRKFQEDRGIDVEKYGFHHVPLCYKAILDDSRDGIFFEDLKASGFEMFDRLKDVTKERVFVVMKSLARFHALSYAIKDQDRKLIEPYFELKDVIMQVADRENSPILAFHATVTKQTFDALEESENIEMVEKIKSLLQTKMIDLFRGCLSNKSSEPYAVICHGDCWNNNLLFKHDEQDSPIDIRFLDFQHMRFASPVCDLAFYFFGCTTKALRDMHYDEFLNVYYEELSSFMTRLGSNPELIFPRKAFDQQLKHYGHFGLLMAMKVLPIFTSRPEDILDMDEFSENLKKVSDTGEVKKDAFNFLSEATYDNYLERMLGVCEDMVRLGYV